MAYEHRSGLPLAFDRAQGRPEQQSVVFKGSRPFIQAPEMNEVQTIIRGRHDRLSRLIAKDGDRIEGAAAIVQRDLGNVILTAGRIWVQGDEFPVAQKVLSAVPMTGRFEIGIRVNRTWPTHEEMPELLGIVPGSLAEGEPGAAREVVTIEWGHPGDGGTGTFVPVYQVLDGTVLDQTPPPMLDGAAAAVRVYDADAHGSYAVRGCRVTALGLNEGKQVFSIEEGVANIVGFKRTRYAALRHAQPEEPVLEVVDAEVHEYPGGATATFTVSHAPIAAAGNALVTKEVTETVTRGGVLNGSDALGHNSVTQIIEVKQGATTFTTWQRSGDQVDWSPAGAEPAPGSTYQVKYRYLESVSVTFSPTSITVAGGVAGTTVILTYSFKLPRIDLLCLNNLGEPVYVKGVSARTNPLPPLEPADLLALAEIHNDWMGTPAVDNNGTRSTPFAEIQKLKRQVVNLTRLVALERLKSEIDAREPTAKLNMFVDPFHDDYYRDEGEVQTAAVADGLMQLPITPTIFIADLTQPVMLDWTEEVVLAQERATGCVKINPYQNFLPLPAALAVAPAVDFWVEHANDFTSPITREFNRGVRQQGPLTTTETETELVGQREEQLQFLRQIQLTFTVTGMGAGEVLKTLTFDGVNVKPPGVQTADAAGAITGTFIIPANVTAGVKEVLAEGMGGAEASAFFMGQGTVEIDVLRQVTTINRWRAAPVTTRRAPVTGQPDRTAFESSHGSDPQGETFILPETRQLVGIDFKLCAIGDTSNNILVHQTTVEGGVPTRNILAEGFVPMAGAVNGWKQARYQAPTLTPAGQPRAFVVKTDDADHSIAIANTNDFDTVSQSYIGAQPYAIGVRVSGSQDLSWTVHQDSDVTFRIVAAKFGPVAKTVQLGSFNLVDCSDLQVRAAVELPSSDCGVVFEIVRPGGEVIRCLPYQVIQLTEYRTETVQLRAILFGTEKLSPTLFAPIYLIAGKLEATGTYVSRRFRLGAGVRLSEYVKAKLPSGSSATYEYDKGDGNWLALPAAGSEGLQDPAWSEIKREASGITAVEGRIRLIIAGTPAARPALSDLSAGVM